MTAEINNVPKFDKGEVEASIYEHGVGQNQIDKSKTKFKRSLRRVAALSLNAKGNNNAACNQIIFGYHRAEV